MDIINKEGFIWIDKFSDEHYKLVVYLEKQNFITTIEKAGIDFMNGAWCYILTGNPDGVYVKTEGNESWITI